MRSLAQCWLASFILQPLLLTFSAGQAISKPTPIFFDVSRPIQAPGPADFRGDSAMNLHGETIGMNAQFLTLDGKPWLPVMGEFHYTCVPANEWEEGAASL